MKKIYLLLVLSCLSIVAFGQSTTFSYSGSVTRYVVPAGVTLINISASGAQGGSSSYYSGGLGANMGGNFTVTPGQVLKIIAGQQPSAGSYNVGGGGGGSFVWDSASSTLLIAAGGGGGGGYSSSAGAGLNAVTTNNGTSGAGGYNGGGVGGYGGTTPTSFAGYSYWASGGAGWLSGGNTGSVSGSCYSTGGSTPLTGGAGGVMMGSTSAGPGGFGGGGAGNARCGVVGGGGGGGYSGGGPGCDNSSQYQPGGGGGSYNSGTSQTSSVTNTGHGQVVITTLGPTVLASPASLNFGIVTTGAYSTLTTTLTGMSLTSGDSLTITPTSNFDISLDGTTFSSTALHYTYSGTSFSSVTLYVRFNPTAVTSYSSNVTITGGGLGATMNIAVSGIGANPCSGTPTAGTTSITPAVGGSSTTFNLTLSGYATTGGITFQWQSSADGGTTWTNVSGATNTTYSFSGLTADRLYRCNVTCTNSGITSPSTSSLAGYYPPSSCTPGHMYGCSGYPMNTSLASLVGYIGTITDPSSTCTADYTDNSSTMAVTLYAGATYPATINVTPTYYSNFSAQVWIDFSNNGTFETSESVGGVTSFSSPSGTATLTIPSTVTPGSYRMRVAGNYVPSTGGATYPGINPCPNSSTVAYGEVRDYMATIIPLPACTTPTAQPTSLSMTSALFSVTGSFTGSAGGAANYLVVRTTTATPPTAPTDGTAYTPGSSALGGVIVSNSGTTTFTATGLTPGTTYYFWIFANNALCSGGTPPYYATGTPLSGSIATTSCALSGTKTVGPTGDYATLTAAIAALNNYGVAGSVALELQTSYDGSTETFPVVVPNIPCISATNNVVIRPQGTMTVTGSYSGPLISMNGARYVTIDGRVGSTGSTKALTILNTSTVGQDLQFVNNSQYNKLKYVTFRGVNTSSSSGVVVFSVSPTAAAGTGGNSYNRMDYCDVMDGATTPNMLIYSVGTSGNENKYDTISNCNIANHMGTSTNAGLYLSSYNSYWTIDGNHLYASSTLTPTISATRYEIYIGSGLNGFNVTNNVIGYSSPSATGTYSIAPSSGTYAYTYGIYMSVGTGVVSQVQGNTISNITMTTTGGAYCYMYCMYLPGGSFSIGDVTPNTIGGTTGNDKLVINSSYSSVTLGFYGLYVGGSAGSVTNVVNNNIGGLTANNSTTTGGSYIYAMYIGSTGNTTVTGNTIGSNTTSNSIYASGTATGGSQYIYGLYVSVSSSALVNPIVSNNTIANITNNSTYTSGSYTYGIYSSSSALLSLTGNTIHDITGKSAYTSTSNPSVAGMYISGSTNPANIDNNSIYTISNANTTTSATQVAGIYYSGNINGSITRNKIYDLRNASTGTSVTAPPVAAGIILYSPNTSITIANNMISLGNSQTTNTSFTGIMNNLSTTYTLKAYYNSINIEGTVTSGALNSTAFRRGNYSTSSYTGITVDVRNNIFVNNRTGGTGKHYAISNNGTTSSSSGWPTTASNYNILKTANSATVGYWSADKTFANWKTASGGDANSYSTSTVTFNNTATGNLHINMGTTANDIESHGTTISGFNTDYDNDARPGPAGSTNGGGIAPDLGADEFDGVPNDNLPPTITYTALLGACGTGNRTVTATIADYSGVPTTGTTRPMIYYKRTTDGSWYSQYGTLTSGSGTSGTWSFTILASDMSGLAIGQTVQYYIIAQDNIGQVGSVPSAGLVASSVTSVTTPPTTPNTYNVLISLSGTKTVGTGGDYTTLTAAVTDYNNACLSGGVTFSLISTTYPSETFPIQLNLNPFASAANTLTISPASGTAVAINGPATPGSIFKFVNARNITIDGVNTGGASLTLTSTYTSTYANIWLASTSGTGPGCKKIAIKNTNIVGGYNYTSSYGILAGVDNGSTPTTTAGMDNDSITVQGNTFSTLGYGIYANGTAFNQNGGINDWTISGNTFGPATSSTTNNIYYRGLYMSNAIRTSITNNTFTNIGVSTYTSNVAGVWMASNCDTVTVSQNDFGNITSSYGYYANPVTAVYFGSNVIDGTITRNNIHDIGCPPSSSYPYAGMGIVLYTNNPNSNILITNNMISNIYGNNYNSYLYWPTGILTYNTTGGVKIYYNSINLYGTESGYSSGNTASSCISLYSSGANFDIRNNILSNTLHNTNNSSDKGYAIYSAGPSSMFTNIDYNDYFVDGSNFLGYLSSNRSTMADMQAGFGGDTHSQNLQPIFVAPTNLHLAIVGANVPFLGSATPLGAVTVDYDNTTRSGTAPVQGCHEVVIPACNTVALTAGTPAPITSVFCNSGNTTINSTGSTGAVGITYQWMTSADSTAWTNVAGATSFTYTPASAITATTFYRLKIGCSMTGMYDSATTKVTINPNPAAFTGNTNVCAGSTSSLSTTSFGGTWSSSTAANATVDATFGVVTGVTSGTSTITYTLPTGCFRTSSVNVLNPAATPAIAASTTALCNNSIASLSVTPGTAVNLVNGWESGVPTSPSTPIAGWSTNAGSTAYLSAQSSGTNPSCSPHSGSTMVRFYSYGYCSIQAALISPAFSLVNKVSPRVTFWVYRDANAYNTTSYITEGWQVWINTTNSIGGGTQIGFVPRAAINSPSAGVSGVATTTTSGWFQYSIEIPSTFTGSTNYIFFNGVSQCGENCFLDDVAITAIAPTAPSWTSATDLFRDAAATVPYIAGDTVNTVYFHPTTYTSATPVVYTATTSNGACTTDGNVTINVNPQPDAIVGANNVCFGLTTSLSDATSGGVWTSSNPAVASVGTATGAVTGLSTGTTNVSYTLSATGCQMTQVMTVNPLPADITGTATACVGATTNLADGTAGGSWSSGTTAIANVGATDGVVSGVSAGLAIITYMLPTGCIKTVESTINPLPVTTITPSSVATLCAGESTPFTAYAPQPAFNILLQDFNAGIGTWNITNIAGTSASYWQTVASTYSGATGDGTQMLEAAADATGGAPTETILTSPSFSTMGYAAAHVSFNQYLISLASSDANVDVDYSTDNGATWNNVLNQVGVVDGSGSWSSTSTPEVTAALPPGALGQPSVKLRWHYNSNWGLYWDIDNIKVTAFQDPVTYSWSGTGGATGLSCSACGSTTVTPSAVGANVYSVVSTTSAGCTATDGVTVNVNPLPSAITGTAVVCVNATTTLTDADAGGTWSSADANVSIDASTGVVTGMFAGTALITYTLPTGCRNTTIVTINPLPSTTTGIQQVCEGLTTTLSNATPGGTWSSSFTAVATVDATSGVVSGIVAGAADIYYTLTATGCQIAANVTVNPTPQPIAGSLQVCEGTITTLSDTDPDGSWTSGTTSVASIDGVSGTLYALSSGETIITYELPTGCINTATVTVNALPAAITGALLVCQGLTTSLDDASAGGTWSTASADATVDAMGVVTGVNAGVATITYQLSTSCVSTADVTVNPTPAAIGGTPQVCVGLTTALSDADAGGTWASGSTGIATVDASGIVSGIAAGTSTITYQLPTGCINTVDVEVNPAPAAITGTRQVCEGMTTTLSNSDPGGVWSTAAFATATVDASGIVSGLSNGIATITYQLPTGCINTADVTVNPLPAAIIGSNQVCTGLSTALVNTTPGGSWNSSNPASASVDGSGTVYAYAPGNTTISYTLSATGCMTSMDMTVNPSPAAITGVTQVCEAGTTNLADATTGGVWSSGNIMTASVSSTGTVSGISAGSTPITYMLPTGCTSMVNVTVNPLPAAITGSAVVCENANTTLMNTSAGGAWTSGAIGIATVGAGTGVVTGVTAGNAPITYTLPTGCGISTDVTVNPNPAAITGTQQVCSGLSTGLASATAGGTWSSSLPSVASVDASSGVVTGNYMGNATIVYTLPTSCKATAVVTVNPLPAPIAGSSQVCEGATATLTDGTGGGTWSSTMTSVATTDGAGGVNGIASGTTIIVYTLPTGCTRTRVMTVNPLPAAIAGTMQVCQSNTTALSNATAGGVWTSSTPTVAIVNSTGMVSGAATGTSTIAYTLPTGCRITDVVTVNQLPPAISGSANACEGNTTSLGNTMPGGAWTSASTAIATVDGTTGVVTGVMAGSTTITYELPTGCRATRNIVVNPQPAAIAGTPQVCHGSTTALSNTVTGGVWSSSNTAVASVGLMTGSVMGLAPGTVDISYTLLTGCAVTATLVVDALPDPIAGTLSVCNGQSTILSSTTTGGTWSSSNPTVGDVSTSGTVSAMAPGITAVTYELSNGCKRISNVTVNALPATYNVTGGGNYCAGSAAVHIGLDGSNSGVNYQLYSGTAPVGIAATGITGLPLDFGPIASAGTYSVVARNAVTGCSSDMTGSTTVSVNPVVAPTVAVVTASDEVCAGVPTSYTTSVTNGGTTPVYVWKVNGIVIPGATNSAFTYTPDNGDVVTNVMTSSDACASPASASGARTMTVNANMLPVASAIATSGANLCEGSTATFTVSSLYGGTSPMYTWLKNGLPAGTGATFAYVPTNGDHISVKMLSNYSCRLADSVASPAITIATNPVYIPAVEIASNYGFFVNENTNVTLSALVATGGPAPVYQWYLNATAVPGATNGTYSKVFSNGDSVTCQVTGSGVCGMSTFNSVVMRVGPTSVAGTTIGNADVRLVPNPNKGEFTVKGTLAVKADKEVSIEVTNVLGQVVYRTNVMARNGEVDARIKLDNTLANGMYMLNMIAGEDKKVFHFVLEQ